MADPQVMARPIASHDVVATARRRLMLELRMVPSKERVRPDALWAGSNGAYGVFLCQR
jgi:hypothetical protein